MATGRQQEDQVAWFLNPCHTLFIAGLKGFWTEKKTANSFYDRLFLPLAAGELGFEEQFVTPMSSSASKAKFHWPPLNHLKYMTVSLGAGQCARSHIETE